jgi:hypothetical protein
MYMKHNRSLKVAAQGPDFMAHSFYIYVYNGGSVHKSTSEKNKIDTTVSTFVYWLLPLHVSTLMLGHHQVYNNRSK